uniref:Uncharacterized protein n=1 Tax=Rhizophagus irregularis (strain DAOM 181602 / DAOM 197198 / MUCL 43194) TaxID=747089 RepID=U9THC9_RHIID
MNATFLLEFFHCCVSTDPNLKFTVNFGCTITNYGIIKLIDNYSIKNILFKMNHLRHLLKNH